MRGGVVSGPDEVCCAEATATRNGLSVMAVTRLS
jgi:hypothetical protein